MNFDRNSRRNFLRMMASVAAGGGAAALFPQLRMMGTALASTSTLTGYKALVCVNLSGGNDSWNMLVPYDTARFNTYVTSRGGIFNSTTNPSGLALPRPTGAQVALQRIVDGNDTSSATNEYFVHPSLEKLANLYRNNKLAFITNVGTLVRPITKTDYNNASNRPAQLYSHSDQGDQWGQGSTTARTQGWGGMLGDLVRSSNSNTMLSPCISVSGASRFLTGVSTTSYQMNSTGLSSLSGFCNVGSTCWPGHQARDNALNEMLAATYASDITSEYARTFKRARDLYTTLATGLAGTNLTTDWSGSAFNTSIARQLQMVAKMIKLSKSSGLAARQIYLVDMGGYDMHDKLMVDDPAAHAPLLTQLSNALDRFQTTLGPTDVNVANEVTTFTSSEFARTLSSNGDGSDHAWGGVQMVMGGAVLGGKLYANGGGPISGFPDQTLNGPVSFSRGQTIPGIGVEQYGAALARWMGITSAGDLSTIFPNLGQFSSSPIGFI